jgi:hypothetical protein
MPPQRSSFSAWPAPVARHAHLLDAVSNGKHLPRAVLELIENSQSVPHWPLAASPHVMHAASTSTLHPQPNPSCSTVCPVIDEQLPTLATVHREPTAQEVA